MKIDRNSVLGPADLTLWEELSFLHPEVPFFFRDPFLKSPVRLNAELTHNDPRLLTRVLSL